MFWPQCSTWTHKNHLGYSIIQVRDNGGMKKENCRDIKQKPGYQSEGQNIRKDGFQNFPIVLFFLGRQLSVFDGVANIYTTSSIFLFIFHSIVDICGFSFFVNVHFLIQPDFLLRNCLCPRHTSCQSDVPSLKQEF